MTKDTLKPRITTEAEGHVLLIGLNRPEKMNAFDSRMLREFSAAFEELDKNSAYRCGVVFAHGEHFTAGLDLAEVAPQIAQGNLSLGGDGVDPWRIHGHAVGKPVVMAIQGRCLTLGIELALAVDIRVAPPTRASPRSRSSVASSPSAAPLSACRRPGCGNAMRYLLTGDEFGADEALRLGLVQEVVEPGQELERALSIARTVAAQAPLGVRATLESARRAEAAFEEEAARALMPELLRLMGSDDAREGLMSFIERRAAKFTGT